MNSENLSWRFRLLGLLPLAFFLSQGLHYWQTSELGHMFWMCNVGNLLLAIGLFLGQPMLIRVAGIWMVPGLVVWFLYVVIPYGVFWSSMLAHIGASIVAMIALYKVRVDRSAWLYALTWYFIVHLMSRWFTPVEMNVNVAQKVQTGWEQTFTSYWKFWLALALMVTAGLWVLGKVFSTLWPAYATEAGDGGVV